MKRRHDFMARLDQLDVMSRKLLAGKMKGERRSKRGAVVEFADYRNYTSAMISASSTGTFTPGSTAVPQAVSGRGRSVALHPAGCEQELRFRHAEQRRSTSSRWRRRSGTSAW
jgi:hypothetical protein